MTPETMADALVSEMAEDYDRLADSIVQFKDRWGQYAKQFGPGLTPQQRWKLDAALNRFNQKTGVTQ